MHGGTKAERGDTMSNRGSLVGLVAVILALGAAPPSRPTADDVEYFRALDRRFARLDLGALTRMDRLELNIRKLDDDGLARLRHLTSLTNVTLDGAGVTDSGLAHLEPL